MYLQLRPRCSDFVVEEVHLRATLTKVHTLLVTYDTFNPYFLLTFILFLQDSIQTLCDHGQLTRIFKKLTNGPKNSLSLTCPKVLRAFWD